MICERVSPVECAFRLSMDIPSSIIEGERIKKVEIRIIIIDDHYHLPDVCELLMMIIRDLTQLLNSQTHTR